MTEEVQTMVGSVVVIGVLTCVLLHFVCDLKVANVNIQNSLIQKLKLYEFELDHKTTEGEGTVDHSTVNR